MKKSFLVLVLVLILISLLSTGTLALYTQTRELRGSLSTRVLILKANEKPVSYELDLGGLLLMPGETADLYRFDITNAADSFSVSDYLMNVSIRSEGMASAISAMAGLQFSLYDAAQEGGSPIATVFGGELLVEKIAFPMGVRKTVQYRLTATWKDTSDSAGQTALASSKKTFPIKIYVTAQAEN